MNTETYRYNLAQSLTTPLSRPAFTGWCMEPDLPISTFVDYYEEEGHALPISGDDTARSRAWYAATGRLVGHQLHVDVDAGTMGVVTRGDEPLYAITLEDAREALAHG